MMKMMMMMMVMMMKIIRLKPMWGQGRLTPRTTREDQLQYDGYDRHHTYNYDYLEYQIVCLKKYIVAIPDGEDDITYYIVSCNTVVTFATAQCVVPHFITWREADWARQGPRFSIRMIILFRSFVLILILILVSESGLFL